MPTVTHPPPKSRRWKWLGGIAGGLILVAVMLSLPTFRGTSEENPGAKNLARLKKIGAACRLYAMDNAGAYPESLARLDPDYLSALAQQNLRYFEPINRKRHDWLYFSGYSAQSDPSTIILAAPRAAQNGYRLVLYANLANALLGEAEYESRITAQLAQ